MEPVFRRARAEDVVAIVALLADDVFGNGREQTADGPIDDRYRRAFDAIDADDRQLLVVAEHEAAVVATLQLSFIPSMTFTGGLRAQIEGVRVDGSVRGDGVGRAMVEWAVEQAVERGCHLVQLTTDKRRGNAVRFYESLGFVVTHKGMKRHL